MKLKLLLYVAFLVLAMGCRKGDAYLKNFKIDKVATYTFDNGSVSITLNKGSRLQVKEDFDNSLAFFGEAYIVVDSAKSSFRDALKVNAAGYKLYCSEGAFNVNVFASSGKPYESSV